MEKGTLSELKRADPHVCLARIQDHHSGASGDQVEQLICRLREKLSARGTAIDMLQEIIVEVDVIQHIVGDFEERARVKQQDADLDARIDALAR